MFVCPVKMSGEEGKGGGKTDLAYYLVIGVHLPSEFYGRDISVIVLAENGSRTHHASADSAPRSPENSPEHYTSLRSMHKRKKPKRYT